MKLFPIKLKGGFKRQKAHRFYKRIFAIFTSYLMKKKWHC